MAQVRRRYHALSAASGQTKTGRMRRDRASPGADANRWSSRLGARRLVLGAVGLIGAGRENAYLCGSWIMVCGPRADPSLLIRAGRRSQFDAANDPDEVFGCVEAGTLRRTHVADEREAVDRDQSCRLNPCLVGFGQVVRACDGPVSRCAGKAWPNRSRARGRLASRACRSMPWRNAFGAAQTIRKALKRAGLGMRKPWERI
jgi:hypothetical protein